MRAAHPGGVGIWRRGRGVLGEMMMRSGGAWRCAGEGQVV